jgi:hypothetical protein
LRKGRRASARQTCGDTMMLATAMLAMAMLAMI